MVRFAGAAPLSYSALARGEVLPANVTRALSGTVCGAGIAETLTRGDWANRAPEAASRQQRIDLSTAEPCLSILCAPTHSALKVCILSPADFVDDGVSSDH